MRSVVITNPRLALTLDAIRSSGPEGTPLVCKRATWGETSIKRPSRPPNCASELSRSNSMTSKQCFDLDHNFWGFCWLMWGSFNVQIKLMDWMIFFTLLKSLFIQFNSIDLDVFYNKIIRDYYHHYYRLYHQKHKYVTLFWIWMIWLAIKHLAPLFAYSQIRFFIKEMMMQF